MHRQLDLSLNNPNRDILLFIDNLHSLNLFLNSIQLCDYSPLTPCPSPAPSKVQGAPLALQQTISCTTVEIMGKAGTYGTVYKARL